MNEAVKQEEELIELFNDRLPGLTTIISVGIEIMFLFANHIYANSTQ